MLYSAPAKIAPFCNGKLDVQHCEKRKDGVYTIRCDHVVGASSLCVHAQIGHYALRGT